MMTSDTVENCLGNSMWVLLSTEAQRHFAKELATPNLNVRLKKLGELTNAENWRPYWTRSAFPNHTAAYDKSETLGINEWSWSTFPHPASLPKVRSKPVIYMVTSYRESTRMYEPLEVFILQKDVYVSAYFHYLLAYSNLLLPPLSPMPAVESESIGDQFTNSLKVIASGNGAALGKGLANEAAKRYAVKLLHEAQRAV